WSFRYRFQHKHAHGVVDGRIRCIACPNVRRTWRTARSLNLPGPQIDHSDVAEGYRHGSTTAALTVRPQAAANGRADLCQPARNDAGRRRIVYLNKVRLLDGR